MITADFFPTTYTDSSSGYERTNTISSLGNGFPAYWLGWMYYDNIPQSMKVSEISFSESRITAQVINIPQNSPVGYVTDNYDYNVDFTGYIKETQFTVSSNQSAYTCYLNGMNCMANAREINISTGNESSTYFMIMRETGTDESLGTHLSPISQPFNNSIGLSTLTDIIDFLKGDKTVTITTTINSVAIPITITADDLNENYYVETMGNANGTFYRICVFIAGYGTSPNYAKSSATGSGSTTWRTISTLKLFTENGSYYVNKNSGCYYTAFYFDSTLTAAYSSNKIANIGFLNGFEFTITKSELQSLVRYAFTFNGNTCFMLDRDYLFMRMYTPSEILHHFALNIRLQERNTPTYGYHTGIYCPEVLDSDEFTGNLLTGELTEDDVQPWQWYNINNNTFEEDDIPPYVPPGPTPGGDDDSGGDDIRPSDWTNLRIGAANNFITLYGMTAETVSDFGRKMWAELADPEFWQMVGTAFTNDFSINPADMMRYFVSLRYFPFDVSDFAHSTSSGVYIGRASTPIAPSVGVAYPLRLTNSTVQVSGGSLTIPRQYNDFRDFEPCTTVQVHIPFCGSVEVPASEVMGHTMDLTYKIDLQTGAMLGVLCVSSNTYYVIATVAGTVGASIPITANNNIEFLQRIATIGGGLVGGGVSGALKGAMLGGEVGAVVGAVAGTVGGGVGALAGLPPVTVHKQGNASGFANLGGVPYAYATVQRSRFELPDNYGHTTGYACDFAATISGLNGYTVCDNVDTSGLSCNSRERDEIKRLLESGVYV